MRHFCRRALLDRNVLAVGDGEIESGNRRSNVERHVVFFSQNGDLIRADFIGGVAVGGDAIRTCNDRAYFSSLQEMPDHIVRDQREWNAAFVQPSRRPKDGRYGENPNRLQHYYQFQVILKPSPPDIQDLYLNSLKAIGIDPKIHDIRFVEDDWESPTLGAWGLGWECWCDGMEISQFTYFQQVAGFECAPVAGELTYGLERLAMYVQGVENVFDLNFNGRNDDKKVTYGDVFLQAEQEYSRHNFELADTAMLFEQFKMAEAACKKYLDAGWANGKKERHLMALPAYDQCIKASHVFNLLDARGVISVTERQSYILRVRELAKACGEAWLKTAGGGAT